MTPGIDTQVRSIRAAFIIAAVLVVLWWLA